MAKFRKFLAMAMVMCMFVSVLPVQALAAEDDGDNLSTFVHPTETQYTYDENGNPIVIVEINKEDTTGTTADGTEISRTETTTTTTTRNPDGSTQVVVKVEGSESGSKEIGLPEGGVSLNIPNEVGDSDEEEFGDTSMNGIPTGDVKQGEDDTEYNQTTSTVTPGKVTVTTTEKTLTEEFSGETELEYVTSQTTPNGSNDLVYNDDGKAPAEYLPGYEGDKVAPENMADGCEYVYVGSANTSMFVPTRVFDTPLGKEGIIAEYGDGGYISSKDSPATFINLLSEEERANIAYTENGSYVTDEAGYILDLDGNRVVKAERTIVDPDGNIRYLHRIDKAYNNSVKVEGWFEDGEWHAPLNGDNKYIAVWDGPQQFVLVDAEGNVITTYCADHATGTVPGYGYNIENLEDADYYTKEEAAHIRTIALNGYWGTVGTTTDDEGNEVPVEGSLEYMRQKLLASGEFTEEELASLNDGVALTATQMAIWTYSNKLSGINFINTHYAEWGIGDVPEGKEDEVKLVFHIFDYLINLDGTTTENKMTDTVITAENAIKDMSVTVIKKAEDSAVNTDDNSDNDAYVTDLSFALVVEPSGDEEESLKVTLVTSDGQTIVGRICGAKEDEDEVELECDDDGNYWFRNVVLTEGDQTFTLNLEGVQNLKQGVYLYSSEVREGESSQTLVGMANGKRDFDVTMSLSFDLDVEEGLVVTERIWESEYDPIINPPPTPVNDDPPPVYRLANDQLEEIPDEEVPLAAPVTTGDNSFVLLVAIAMAMLMLLAINLPMAKRPRGKHEAI